MYQSNTFFVVYCVYPLFILFKSILNLRDGFMARCMCKL